MIWGQIIWFVVTLVASIALAPKPPKPRSASIDDFEFPTAEEGRPIPVVFGTVRITGPNVLWYGDLGKQAIKQKSMFSSTTVGYKYFVGLHFGIAHGPVDAVTKIEIGDKEAWSGSATANTSVDINKGDLFGGKKREGGIVGTVDMCFGAPAQTVNTYLASKVGSPTPAFRGITGFVFHNTVAGALVTGKSGGYIGTTTYPKPWAFTVRRITKGWVGDAPWYSAKATIGTSMNPAHIIRQCLTDTEWGMGQPTTSFDSSWETAADQFFTEGFGLDLLWNQQTSIEEFIQVVLDHVGGLIRLNRSTGKLGIRLIRADYTPAALSLFNENTIREIKKYQRQAWGETVNEITLTYTDATTRKTTGITVQDLGNIRSQGARVAERVDMPGITSQTIAAKAAARELAARSTPLSTVSFDINRSFWQHSPGDVFRLSWDALGIGDVVFRVIKSKPGSLGDGMVEVEAVEDIYGLPSATYTSIVGPGSAPADDTTADPDDQGGGAIISASITTPPANPTDGDTYFVPSGATGVWATHVGQIATYSADDGVWEYTTPAPGAVVYNQATGTHTDVSGGTATPAPWVAGKVAWVADITPAALAADENNYAPTGLSGASTLRLSASGAPRSINGLTGGEDGRIIVLHNIGTLAITLKDENTLATAANRFALSADVTLNGDQSIMLQYDSTASRWRVIGGISSSSGGGGGGSSSGSTGGVSLPSGWTLVTDATGLANIGGDMAGKYFVAADITVSGNYTPPAGTFTGILASNGRKITIGNTTASLGVWGLFETIGDGAIIAGLHVDINVPNGSSASYQGGIAAYQADSAVSYILDCVVSGTLNTGGDRGGAFVGLQNGSTMRLYMRNCTSTVTWTTLAGTRVGQACGFALASSVYLAAFLTSKDQPSITGNASPVAWTYQTEATALINGFAAADWHFVTRGSANSAVPLSPDSRPASPTAYDDEFDGAGLDSKWVRSTVFSTGVVPTINMANGAVIFTTGDWNPQCYGQAISGNFKVRAKIGMLNTGGLTGYVNYQQAGLYVGRNATAKRISWHILSSLSMEVGRWTNAAFNTASTYGVGLGLDTAQSGVYLEVEYDGTNIIYRLSKSGHEGTYLTVGSEAAATHLGGAPDEVGLMVNRSSATDVKMIVDWFRRVA